MKNIIILLATLFLVGVLLISGCEKSFCGNEKCEKDESSANCCLDCGCPSEYICDNNKCKKAPKCGDGIVDEGETSNNCCIDAGCPSGEVCENNKCVELKPKLSTDFSQSQTQSVTILKSKGKDFSIGQIKITNSGNDVAKNVKLVISSDDQYFDTETINIGSVGKGETTSKDIKLIFKDKILEFSDEAKINLKLDLQYYNSVNKEFSTQLTHSLEVYGRNSVSMDFGKSYSAWVTPHNSLIREFAAKSTSGLAAGLSDESRKLAARWLFESMKAYGVDYVNDIPTIGDYVQFPYETLKRRNADCEDLAILYASLLESIDIKSFLVYVPGHVFAGYYTLDEEMVPVETTADDYDSALLSGKMQLTNNPDARIFVPSNNWDEYPEVLYGENKPLPLPDVTKEIVKDCYWSWDWSKRNVIKTQVKFVNTGDSPGAGCAGLVSYQNGKKIDEDFKCWRLVPGEDTTKEYVADISIFNALGFSCRTY